MLFESMIGACKPEKTLALDAGNRQWSTVYHSGSVRSKRCHGYS